MLQGDGCDATAGFVRMTHVENARLPFLGHELLQDDPLAGWELRKIQLQVVGTVQQSNASSIAADVRLSDDRVVKAGGSNCPSHRRSGVGFGLDADVAG